MLFIRFLILAELMKSCRLLRFGGEKKPQEAVLLDLLRVISHHRARLATPIRTVQKVYSDADLDNIPFSETMFTRAGAAVNRPLLLVEPSYKINGEEKAKPRATPRANEEQALKNSATEAKPTTGTDGAVQNNSEKQQEKKTNLGDLLAKSSKGETSQGSPSTSTAKSQIEGGEKLHPAETGSEQAEVAPAPAGKNGTERPASSPSVAKTVFQNNLVLEVALEGSKRTLPIEEEMRPAPPPEEPSEMAASRSTNGPSPSKVKDRKGPMPASDQREQERGTRGK